MCSASSRPASRPRVDPKRHPSQPPGLLTVWHLGFVQGLHERIISCKVAVRKRKSIHLNHIHRWLKFACTALGDAMALPASYAVPRAKRCIAWHGGACASNFTHLPDPPSRIP